MTSTFVVLVLVFTFNKPTLLSKAVLVNSSLDLIERYGELSLLFQHETVILALDAVE